MNISWMDSVRNRYVYELHTHEHYKANRVRFLAAGVKAYVRVVRDAGCLLTSSLGTQPPNT